jgi:oligopeptidase B
MKRVTMVLVLSLFILTSHLFGQTKTSSTTTDSEISMNPPVAKKLATVFDTHGTKRVDEYFWMRERANPQVTAYLKAENDYTQHVMSDTKAFEKQVFDETKARIKQDDSSVPYADRGYVYYTRFAEGQQYPIICRRKDEQGAAEQIMLDVNRLAEGKPFCRVSGAEVSSGGNVLAYATDYVGRRIYTLRFRDLDSGTDLPDEIPNVTGNVAWGEDNKTIYYTRQDPQTLRSYQIYRHELGTDPAEDALVFQEEDEEYSCSVFKSRSREYVIINSDQTLSTECYYMDAKDPSAKPKSILPREADHEYSVDHLGDSFYVRTNWKAKNFRLMKTPVGSPDKTAWTEVVPHREDVFLASFELFRNHLVTQERENGLTHLRIREPNGALDHSVEFQEPAYAAFVTAPPNPDTPWLRYNYTSMTTPPSDYEYEMDTRQRKLLKQEEVLGRFDSSNYRTERLWATARDGTKIPVSVVYRKDTQLDGKAPCLVYGYGSYGSSMSARFSSSRLNLLDRGFVFAIAHVRGGQEMGRDWYENGKLLKKKNTFTDFIDVTEFLIREGYADPERTYAQGGSAGGLLMGAIVNMRPDLYHGVVADVPFVDVVTTMLDDSIPLTTSEYDEWGNPHEREYFDYMLSYSPYDNVGEVHYPNMLVTTGLHDSQVQYWEPAKWVARLREKKADQNLLLLKTNMDAGHGGASGRFDRYKEVVFRHVFLLRLAGKVD